jgi:DNA polymerase-3 subunit alpha
VTFRYPDIPEFTVREKLLLEKESAGMFLSGHILDDYTRHTDWLSPVTIRSVLDAFGENGDGAYAEKQVIRVVAILTRVTQKNTKNGDVMAFATAEDRSGEIELIIFPKTLLACGNSLRPETPVALEAEISLKDDEPKLIVRSLSLLQANDSFKAPTASAPPVNAGKEANAPRRPLAPVHPSDSVKTLSEVVTAPTSSREEERNVNAVHKTQKLWLKVPNMEGKLFRQALAICEIFSGETPLAFYDLSSKKYISAGIGVEPSDFVRRELSKLLGSDAVVLR